ncbi:hypothetical protein [Treponema zioleckii]|uniref:hypothetical protein n=1 Tax=Treponema zioleckii TaxID=331680 RepID=UPI00168B03F6|nr:hypothetical protein [Treponema zioleckii]
MKRSYFLACIILAFSLPMLVSCLKQDDEIHFEQLNELEVFPTVQWAVVKDPYVAARKEGGYDSVVLSSLRKGDLVQIEGNCTVKVESPNKKDRIEEWYAVSGGWVPASSLVIYTSYRRALTAQKQMLKE